jgi:hypothetical protein
MKGCGFRIPRDLEPALPGVLWLLPMGAILFWVIDELPGQARSHRVFELSSKIGPSRKTALEVIEIVKGGVHGTA